jgi:hypothetical protein
LTVLVGDGPANTPMAPNTTSSPTTAAGMTIRGRWYQGRSRPGGRGGGGAPHCAVGGPWPGGWPQPCPGGGPWPGGPWVGGGDDMFPMFPLLRP